MSDLRLCRDICQSGHAPNVVIQMDEFSKHITLRCVRWEISYIYIYIYYCVQTVNIYYCCKIGVLALSLWGTDSLLEPQVATNGIAVFFLALRCRLHFFSSGGRDLCS